LAGDAELELTPARVLVPSVTSCGVQLNQHVYAAITGAAPETFADLEQKVLRLEPQFVRVFYNDRHEMAKRDKGDKLESFRRTVELAQQAGATINVTWQSGGVKTPEESMSRFSDVLADLVTSRGVAHLRWVTIQNEPNSTKITPAQNAAMYRALDRSLESAGVREQIRFMGGDLVEQNQQVWFEHMARQLADILDAYSVHIYWDYTDTTKFARRLRDVQQIVSGLPASGRKPVFVTEYGVRGEREAGEPKPGFFADGTPIGQTTIAAFQQAWFKIMAAQLGYAGTVKWDCYYGKYDRRAQAHYAIGPWQDGWPLYPTYFLLRLVTRTTQPGWRVVALERREASAATKELAAFAGPAGELTILGLDSAGATLNGVSPTQVSYTIGGLPPDASFTLVVWNQAGGGRNHIVGNIAADSEGVATVEVPLHAVFALTTRPVAPE